MQGGPPMPTSIAVYCRVNKKKVSECLRANFCNEYLRESSALFMYATYGRVSPESYPNLVQSLKSWNSIRVRYRRCLKLPPCRVRHVLSFGWQFPIS